MLRRNNELSFCHGRHTRTTQALVEKENEHIEKEALSKMDMERETNINSNTEKFERKGTDLWRNLYNFFFISSSLSQFFHTLLDMYSAYI